MKNSIFAYILSGVMLLLSTAPITWAQSSRSELAALNRQRAELSMEKGKFDRAIGYLDTALQNTPRDPALYLLRGKAYLANKDPRAAILDFNQAIRLDPKLGEAYFQRGQAYQLKGKAAKAERDVAKAKQLGYEAVKDQ